MNVSLKLCPERDLNPHARIKWALAPQASASTIPPPGQYFTQVHQATVRKNTTEFQTMHIGVSNIHSESLPAGQMH